MTASAYKGGAMFAFELYNGRLYPVIKADSRNQATERTMGDLPAGSGNYNNGQWHTVRFKIDSDGASLTVDQTMTEVPIPQRLDISKFGAFYIGGVDPNMFNTSFDFPMELRTAVSQVGFTGCIKDMLINGNSVELVNYAQRSQGTEVGCARVTRASATQTCKGARMSAKTTTVYALDLRADWVYMPMQGASS